MSKITLGRTGIVTDKNAFGALPAQRVSLEYAVMLFRKALEGGITFFDTARGYTDSEEKLGAAFSGMRDKIILATKTHGRSLEEFWSELEASLRMLKTDYIDVYQFHNTAVCPLPGDGTGLYEAMLEAKKQGKIRFIGFTNHKLNLAEKAVTSGMYDTLQFPFSHLADQKDIDLVKLCEKHNVGFIAMKALSGGFITNSEAASAWLGQFENVLPIWGIQRESELDEFLGYIKNPPVLNERINAVIEKDRKELAGNFCRGCGYCMPCPAGITINTCARMIRLIRRSPSANLLSEKSREMMLKIEDCTGCGACKKKCPYDLDTPALLKANLEDYKNILAGKVTV